MSWMIKIENVSKMYRLGLVNSSTIQDDLKRTWYKWRGKDDPFLKIGEENKRNSSGGDYVWALKDINFEVKKGEILGIIGKNGAGKSTLLKLLSKVTRPSIGSIKTKGRIASLLEVGTGFHPELTGRENIYLNGSILGMRKHEIKSKFNEIVDFSGCERYIDTPVKRYSSGMYVRLAFAVAAHLDPEILVVDEVLAVGDAEFQKKAIGKMKDVSEDQGRTVLFVSHNMTAIENLCSKSILLENGQIKFKGDSKDAIEFYLKNETLETRKVKFNNQTSNFGNDELEILCASIENISKDQKEDPIYINDNFSINFDLKNLSNSKKLFVGFDLKSGKGDVIFGSGDKFDSPYNKSIKYTCEIPGNLLNDGFYNIFFYVYTDEMRQLFKQENTLCFQVKDLKRKTGFIGKVNGMVRPNLQWNSKSI